MGNSQYKLNSKFNKLQIVKPKLKFCSVAPDIKIARAVLQKAPNAVISAIFNGALNARQGVVTILPQMISLLWHHNHHLIYIVTVKSQFSLSNTWLFRRVVLFL